MDRGRSRSVLVILILILVAGCSTSRPIDVSPPYHDEASDYSNLPYLEAFDALFTRLEREYAFTEWKGIDWHVLRERYRPLVAAAEEEGDAQAYYLALRSFIYAIPDRHVSISSIAAIDEAAIAGGFGIAAALLDDRRLVITWVDEQSAAHAAGFKPGQVIDTIDSRKAWDAVLDVEPLFISKATTDEELLQNKALQRFRAPVGTAMQITTTDNAAILYVYDDVKESMKHSYPDAVVSDALRNAMLGREELPLPASMVEYHTPREGVFAIKVWGLFDADLDASGTMVPTLEQWRAAIDTAIAQETTLMIVDLRNNVSGLDELSALMLGSFYETPTLYEHLNTFVPQTGTRDLMRFGSTEGIYINAAPSIYTGKVVALTNHRTVSSGEGLAMGIKRLENGETLGFWGTNGSFGLAGCQAMMGEDIIIRWPSGQSLDERYMIQLDSKDGVGGVTPSIRIAWDLDRALAVSQGIDVEFNEALRLSP